jgi:UDP-N-acetyl-D-mannosaminuronate dehydrogenase
MMMMTRTLMMRSSSPVTGIHSLFSHNTTDKEEDTVEFLGLGNMGLPMAINLANKSTQNIIVLDLNEQVLEKIQTKSTIYKQYHILD